MTENPHTPPQFNSENVANPSETNKKHLSGLGGWLIVLCLWLFLSLLSRLILIIQIIKNIVDGTWLELTSPGQPSYDSMWAPTIISEITMAIMSLIMTITVLVSFFRKKKSFVPLLIICVLSDIVIGIIDLLLVQSIVNFQKSDASILYVSLGKSVVYAMIWCLYIMNSVRVKNTFTH